MGLQFVQLRGRSATRCPTDVRLNAIAGGTSKSGKRHRHRAKQRRDVVSPPVLQVAFSAAGRAARPLQPMADSLRRNDRSLNARQKLLRFGQGQSQVSNITKTFRPADLYQIGAQAAGITLRRNQPQHPSHPRSPGRLSTDRPYPLCRHTPIRWTLPRPLLSKDSRYFTSARALHFFPDRSVTDGARITRGFVSMDALSSSDVFLFGPFRFDRRGGVLLRCNDEGRYLPVSIGSRAFAGTGRPDCTSGRSGIEGRDHAGCLAGNGGRGRQSRRPDLGAAPHPRCWDARGELYPDRVRARLSGCPSRDAARGGIGSCDVSASGRSNRTSI